MVNYKLHFIRHGMTEGNLTGRYVGRMNLPVCAEGRSQLEEMKSKYQYPDVQEVYCSPLLRCLQTADILFPDTPRTVVDDLVELSLGDFEGKSIDELKNTPAYIDWISDSLHNKIPGSLENGEQFATRISGALYAVFRNMTQRKITEAAVVAHGGVFMGLLSAFAMPRRSMGEWALSNGSGYTVIMSTEMWMRDQIIQVAGTVPQGFSAGNDPRVLKSLGIK